MLQLLKQLFRKSFYFNRVQVLSISPRPTLLFKRPARRYSVRINRPHSALLVRLLPSLFNFCSLCVFISSVLPYNVVK